MKFSEFRETIAWGLTVITGILLLYGWVTQPDTSLTATASYDGIEWPSGVDRWYDIVRNLDSSLTKFSEIGIARRVFAKTPFSGYWFVTLKNGEGQELESVTLTIPGAVLAEFHRETDDGVIADTISGVINIGKMHPAEFVTVRAWTWSPYQDVFRRGVQVSHRGGTGKVTHYWKVGPIGQYVDEKWRLIILEIVLLVVIVAEVTRIVTKKRLRASSGELSQKSISNQ